MTDAEKKEYLPQIAATLKYGAFYGGKRKRNLILYISFSLLMVVGVAISLTFLCLDFIDSSYDTVKFVFSIIGIIFGFSFLPIILLVFLVQTERTNKEVLLWLDDAIECGAHSYIYSTSTVNAVTDSKIYRIKINFKIDGKHYSYLSRDYQWGSFLPNGYSSFWKKYIDKSMKILYSPKYEEIMILKEPKNK